METKANVIESLIERVELYGKTSFEILKLKSLDKTAEVTSTALSRLLFLIVVSLFALTLTIAIALWLGDLLEKNYYGFLIVASFYGLAGVILFFIHPQIKQRINNSIIIQMFK